MQQFELTINTLSQVLSNLKQFVRPNIKYVLTLKEQSKRGLSANAQAHVWIKIISEHTGEDIKTTEARCKRDHGLAVALSGDNGAMLSWILERCRYGELSDSQQLKIISAMEITRNFTTAEHKKYRDSIQQFWLGEGLELNYLS